jgi:hypothetical protein
VNALRLEGEGLLSQPTTSALGRSRLYDALDCGRWSDSSCWLALPVIERLQWRFHPRAGGRALWPLHHEIGHSTRFILGRQRLAEIAS